MNNKNNSLNTNSLFNSTLLSPEAKYTIQEWNIPGLTISHPEMNTRSGPMFLQGDFLQYNTLDMKILVDEELVVWREFIGIFQKYQIPGTNTCIPITGDSFIEVYDSKNKYLFKVYFYNCYFKAIGDLRYMTNEDNEIITTDISIAYDYYTIE